MLKIYNPSESKQTIGGGHTFRRNLGLALADKVQFVEKMVDCDIFLISSVTIVDQGEVHEAKRLTKKIVLRVDNMPRKSRNRMSPHERMRDYAQIADAVIYQSEWAQEWIGSYLGVPGQVIYNGIDGSIFKPIKKTKNDDKIFLVVQYNRDENKRIPEAFDMFTKEWLKNENHLLWIVGRFSPELVAANFDFFRGERFEYYGVVPEPQVMASIMQQADILLYPSYSDSCPNTIIEARACGMEIWHHGHAGVGEAAIIPDSSLERMGNEYMKLFETIQKGGKNALVKETEKVDQGSSV